MDSRPNSRRTRWPAGRQIAVLILALVIFQVVLIAASAVMLRGPGPLSGQDFMAFYNAARMTLDGRAADLYDLSAMRAAQATIEAQAGIAPGRHAFAPFLNPPHAALIYCPLAATMGLREALNVWRGISVAFLAVAAWLLARIIGEASALARHRWLCAAAICLAPPTLTALRYGQNTTLSLMLLAIAVAAWRGGRPIMAGLACAALAYKPHLAAIVAFGCWMTMGRRVLIGLAIGGVAIVAATCWAMPGAAESFAGRMPTNLRVIFFEQSFPWQRHVTIGGFLRHLSHGNGPGATPVWATSLTAISVAAVLVATVAAAWRLRGAIAAGDASARDRLIALFVLATPLLMPYFIDYDLALLLVAGVMIARAALADGVDPRGIRLAGMALYGWTLFNPLVAEVAGISLTTPLIIAVFALHARRCWRIDARSRELTSSLRIRPARRDVETLAA